MSRETVSVTEDSHQPVNCAYCHNQLEPGATIVACQKCRTRYHKACWKETGKCGTLNCHSRRYVRIGGLTGQTTLEPELMDINVVLSTATEAFSAPIDQPDEEILEQITILSETEVLPSSTPRPDLLPADIPVAPEVNNGKTLFWILAVMVIGVIIIRILSG